jgi:hypothetical protein
LSRGFWNSCGRLSWDGSVVPPGLLEWGAVYHRASARGFILYAAPRREAGAAATRATAGVPAVIASYFGAGGGGAVSASQPGHVGTPSISTAEQGQRMDMESTSPRGEAETRAGPWQAGQTNSGRVGIRPAIIASTTASIVEGLSLGSIISFPLRLRGVPPAWP